VGRYGAAVGPYRLLTEAEWEYASRASIKQARYWGDRIGQGNANCNGCRTQWDKQIAPAGSFAANGFGLHDMLGNVQEWVEDCWHHDYQGAPTDGEAWTTNCSGGHVLRGGSWGNLPSDIRFAVRAPNNNKYRGVRVQTHGFRVAKDL
jgi:formylglycine-generating enzyme required for sulfatase activity